MSISLRIESYCQDCPHFDAEQDTLKINADNEVVFIEHFVKCKNADLCRHLKEHLKREE